MDRIIGRRPSKRSARDCGRTGAYRRVAFQSQRLNRMRRRRDQTPDSQFLVQPNTGQKFVRQNDRGSIAQFHARRRNTGDNPLRDGQRRHVIDAGSGLGCGDGERQDQAGESELFQCRKCLMPVNTMAIPAASAASITS